MTRRLLLACFAGLLAGACGRSDPLDFLVPKSIEDACAEVCALGACDRPQSVDEGDLALCAQRCVDEHARAGQVSTPCADAYRDYIDCLDALSCDEYQMQIFEGEGGDCRVAAEIVSESCNPGPG